MKRLRILPQSEVNLIILVYIHKHTYTELTNEIAGRGKKFLSNPKSPDRRWDPPNLHSLTTEAVYLRVKQLTHEADKFPHLVEILRMNVAVIFLQRTA
jgi:hypothetical protein